MVTKPEFRGRDLGSALQEAMLAKLKAENIPLAVLRTDKYEIQAGQGFSPAGWELHIDLSGAELDESFPGGFGVREFRLAGTRGIVGRSAASPVGPSRPGARQW